jgi:alpha-glucosidase
MLVGCLLVALVALPTTWGHVPEMRSQYLLSAVLVNGVVAQTDCPGYTASDVQQTYTSLTASLQLAGEACNVYGTDLNNLTLTVEYQTDSRLHILIQDLQQDVYQVPETVVPRPNETLGNSETSALHFTYVESPFSFAVSRKDGEVLFNTSGWPLVFEDQYLGLRTSLPDSPALYGLGEHMDPFQLNTTNYTRTLWSRDAYGIPSGTNLYGNHPVYLDNRGENGTHGVLLLNSNGMDIKINDTDGQYLEYNTLGGVVDLYFVAGAGPIEASQQISDILGKPAMQSYWTFGFHQCRYGYEDVYQVAEVVYNYSVAGVPLETMWTDIDYMELRKVFTLDPERFPLSRMRELVDYLHEHDQHYIVMVDPAVAYQDYDAYNNGVDMDVWLKYDNGTLYQGAVWPGPTVFPDWFHPNITDYWNGEFLNFFSAEDGVDIDGLWIDMNEAANFCPYPCADPQGYAEESKNPPAPPPLRDGAAIPLPGFPEDLQPGAANGTKVKRQGGPPGTEMKVKRQAASHGNMLGLPDRELIEPPYAIQNAAGSLSNKTVNTDLHHANGLAEYDTHNLYGTMMSSASREAMLARRPTVRPLVITRSTFLGAGAHVGHWTGDNAATWNQLHLSIGSMLNFASIFQVPMVGSDVCGFSQNTTETLCARWASLGAFNPFFRNHNADDAISQEFYRWDTVAESARNAINIRYRLLDYFYTAFYEQSVNGTPSLNPLWFLYPADENTFPNDRQFFFGNAILVSPVLEENATSTEIYLPQDIFYDWNDGLKPVQGNASTTTLGDVPFTMIPLHVRGGTILPLRAQSANTTTQLRRQPFQLVIAPGAEGRATGTLYLDDGVSLIQDSTTLIAFAYADGVLRMTGSYGFEAGVDIESLLLLNVRKPPAANNVTVSGDGAAAVQSTWDEANSVLIVNATLPLTSDACVDFGLS